MQRVTVIKDLNCTQITAVFLQLLRSTVIVHLNCGSSMIPSFCLKQCIDCVLNLPINERQCFLQAKQGVYATISHDNLRQKASVCFVFFKGLRGNFLSGGENKTSNYKSCLYTRDPCKGVRSLPPQTKNARYGPGIVLHYVLVAQQFIA